MSEEKHAWYHKGTYCKEPKMYWFDLMWGNTSQQGSGWIGMLPIGETRKYRMMGDNRKQIDPDDCEIMQFTDYQDMNGVGICEGDLVQDEQYIKEIVFHKGVFTVKNTDSRFALPASGDYLRVYGHSLEVVGNIYENPELL